MRIAFFAVGAFIAAGMSVPAHAQNVTILGGNGDAQDCARAAQMDVTSDRALAACDAALASESISHRDRAGTLVNRGILHARQESYQRAYEDYQAALTLRPAMAEAKANRGNLYYLAGRYDEALADYDAALAAGVGQEARIRLNRGMTFAIMGRYDDADAEYQRVLSLKPDWVQAQEVYGRFKAATGEPA